MRPGRHEEAALAEEFNDAAAPGAVSRRWRGTALPRQGIAGDQDMFALADLHVDVLGQYRPVVFGDTEIAKGRDRLLGGW